MKDCNGLVNAGNISEFCTGLMNIAGGFCGKGVISALGDLAVDMLETMSQEEDSTITEEHVDLMRVTVRVMNHNVANRDVLLQKMQVICDISNLSNLPEELQQLPFLLCPDQDTMNELLRIAMKRMHKCLHEAGIPEEYGEVWHL